MKSFSQYHPIVISIYFLSIILTTIIQLHPVFLIISMLCSIIYCYHSKVVSASYVKGLIIMYSIIAISNPILVHTGATILLYVGYTPITLEAIVYGFVFATVIVSMLNWFTLLNACLDSEKIIYLFKNKLPTIGLIISMVLGFVPRFIRQAKRIIETQKTLQKDITKGSFLNRLKVAFTVLLILFTWAFESSLTTLQSMQARGYGKRARTNFHTYQFEQRDQIVISIIMVLDIMFIFGYVTRFSSFYYYPIIKDITFTILDILYYIGYALLLAVPFLLERGGNEYVDI